MAAQLTVLNVMAGADFTAALEQHVAWGLHWVDLKDNIFGKSLLELSTAQAQRAADLVHAHGLQVYCLSTGLLHADIEAGPAAFAAHLAQLEHLLELATIFRPVLIRLLAARSSAPGLRAGGGNSIDYVLTHHPWLPGVYQRAIDALTAAGHRVTIENETHGTLLACPAEVVRFFEALERPGQASFTWDVQNMWQQGHEPSLASYQQLKPLLGYYHLKGGQSENGEFKWASNLKSASWPVLTITRPVVDDGTSPVLCLNPSHGDVRPGDRPDEWTAANLAWLRREIPDIE